MLINFQIKITYTPTKLNVLLDLRFKSSSVSNNVKMTDINENFDVFNHYPFESLFRLCL